MIKKLFKDSTENSFIQFFRYGFVGGAAFAADFATLYICKEYFSMNLILANSLAFIVGLLTNYYISISWVFNKRIIGNSWAEFVVFTVIGIIGLGLNTSILWYFTKSIKIDYKISKLIATAIVYFWNFFARKYILFK